MAVDLRGFDEAGASALLARERYWREMWAKEREAYLEEREKRVQAEEALDRCVTGREG